MQCVLRVREMGHTECSKSHISHHGEVDKLASGMEELVFLDDPKHHVDVHKHCCHPDTCRYGPLHLYNFKIHLIFLI